MSTCRYALQFRREWEDAKREREHLGNLFEDVCWYNFARNPFPWRLELNRIHLHGYRVQWFWNMREAVYFTTWYEGSCCEAPPCPAEILLNEIKLADERVEETYNRLMDPYDWAPGGKKYLELVETTLVGKKFSEKGE